MKPFNPPKGGYPNGMSALQYWLIVAVVGLLLGGAVVDFGWSLAMQWAAMAHLTVHD